MSKWLIEAKISLGFLPRTACSAVEESTTWYTAHWEGPRGNAMRCPSRKTHANAKIDLQRWRAEGKTGKLYIEIETKIRRVEIFADDLPNANVEGPAVAATPNPINQPN